MKSRVLEINGRIGAVGNVEAALGKYIWQPTAGYKTTNTRLSPEQTVGLELRVPDTAQLLQQPHLELPASAQRQYQCRCRKPGPFLRGDAGGQGGVGIPLSRHSGHDRLTIGGGFFKIQYRQYGRATTNSQCYRSYRYGTDFPGLAGKDLSRKGTLSGRLPRLVGSSDTNIPTVTYTGFGFGASGVAAGGGGVGGGTGGGGGGGY